MVKSEAHKKSTESCVMPIEALKYLGEEFSIRMPGPAYFVFGLRKSGSTLLNETVLYLAQRNDVNWVSIPDQLFLANIDFDTDCRRTFPQKLIQPGNVYGGFRVCPNLLGSNELFNSAPKVLMIRDFRDALVSQYFSALKSHFIPQGDDSAGPRRELLNARRSIKKMTIDEFVIGAAPALGKDAMEYQRLIADSNLITIFYENVIFEKNRMITMICEHFGWSVSESGRSDILAHIDVRPTKERANAFVRKVSPGDYLEKLAPDTIAKLNEILHEPMKLFGYR